MPILSDQKPEIWFCSVLGFFIYAINMHCMPNRWRHSEAMQKKEQLWDRSSPFFELMYQMLYFVGLQVSFPYCFKVSSHWILYCLLCPSKMQAPEKQGNFVLNSFTSIYWSITDLKNCTDFSVQFKSTTIINIMNM